MDKESDYAIFHLAKWMNIHQVFGHCPSAQMLLEDILNHTTLQQHTLYVQRSISLGLAQFPTLKATSF
jgi:hypothetical protein